MTDSTTPPAAIDVILPVLDEAEALPWVLERMPPGFAPIVADNGSSDGSAELAERLGARVVREERRGFGAACYAGLCVARSEVVAFMDCDGSLDPGELPRVTAPVSDGALELCLGSRRPVPGAWPLHARAANALLARELRRRTGAPLRDLGPSRCSPWGSRTVASAGRSRWCCAPPARAGGSRIGRSPTTPAGAAAPRSREPSGERS